MKKESILSAKNIRKEFYRPEKITVLHDISIDIGPSESIAIIGASGSGKSTLLQILGTLEGPTSGDLFFHGEKIMKSMLSDIRNKYCGFVFQSSNLLEEYSLLENLLLKAKIARRKTTKGSEAYEEALFFIEQVGLSHRIQFPLKYLSGGEKQRGAIARAFINNPELILADEPTGNLDSNSAQAIMELLTESCRKNNKSLIVVTHDVTFANLVDKKLHLDAGILYED